MDLFKKGLKRGILLLAASGALALYNRLVGDAESVRLALTYGGIGFFLGVMSVIYEVRRWSFPKQIFIHWTVMHVTILPLVFLSGLVPVNSVQDLGRLYVNFNVSGLILFGVTYLVSKARRQLRTPS
ncbi:MULTISPECIES: DUF3021 family protein [Exiguobacterium]|uniref:DUF3021 family protein n=1 Tax=Exiguobacterium TaxID=33986 RepID=UPI001BEC9C02|nr:MULTISPECIES: DUF3021 family protein [Exiguobacterium]MCT4784108.1 DUF3021 domain-containing protein [Exiguobacterium himgiriensis]